MKKEGFHKNINVNKNEVVRITYVQGRGLCEPIRFLLYYCGVTIQEVFLTKKEELQALNNGNQLFYQQLPLIEMDGKKLVQSGATMRYIARKYNMYGVNDKERYIIDLIYEGTRDARTPLSAFQHHKDIDKLKQDFKMDRYLGKWEDYLSKKEGKNAFFTSNVSFADIAVYEILDYLDVAHGIDETKNILENKYPHLYKLKVTIESNEHIKHYKTTTRNHIPHGKTYTDIVDAVFH